MNSIDRLVPAFVKHFLEKNGALIMNLIVCFGILHWMIANTISEFIAGVFNFVNTLFLLHNIVMLVFILIRVRQKDIDRSFGHQFIAVIAFFSGLAFMGTPTQIPQLLITSKIVIVVAMLLGTITLFNLGRSFGILIAYRELKSDFLYSIVRHPMYMTDIIWKIGIILYKPCVFNFAVFVISVSCYVYRALLEERFLSRLEEYREYMSRVRYRFIPGIF